MPSNYYENLTNTEQSTNNTQNQVPITPSTPIPEQPVIRESTQDVQENAPSENTQNEASQNSFPDNSTGRLRVSVSTANQLSPVAGAIVTVSSEDGENSTVLDTSTTDRSGSSLTFTLPAPSASFSQEPTVASPFAVYQVSVSHPDFYEFIAENVQVFGGIVTQLPVNLIPLPELSNGETTKKVIIPNQNL